VEPDVEAKIRTVFQETLFGPEAIDYDADFGPEVPLEQRPDLLKELRYFRKFGDTFLEIDMLLRFTHFDAHGPLRGRAGCLNGSFWGRPAYPFLPRD